MGQAGPSRRAPVTSKSQVQEQYRDSSNLLARAAIYRYGRNQRPWLAWVFDQLQLAQGARLLELGCGPATLWWQNLARVDPSWRVVLSDLMPGMLEEGRQRLGAAAARFAWVQADAQAICFADGAFDAVVANHMLYHVPDRPRALRQIRRVLKHGGRLYAATNGAGHLQSLRGLIDRFVPAATATAPATGLSFGAEPFRLENGQEQLRPWFAEVERRTVCNELAIPQARLIIQYVLSMPGARQQIVGSRLRQLEQAVQAEMPDGLFRTTTQTGLFVARRQ